jgi:hypothetical protein
MNSKVLERLLLHSLTPFPEGYNLAVYKDSYTIFYKSSRKDIALESSVLHYAVAKPMWKLPLSGHKNATGTTIWQEPLRASLTPREPSGSGGAQENDAGAAVARLSERPL